MTRSYGQYCGLARALELIGGRWTLLIVRDLLMGPQRFTDLQVGLPGIPTNILAARLRELEDAGLVERLVLDRAAGSFGYQLTRHGRDLEDAVVQLARWGGRWLGRPAEHDVFNPSSLALALRAAFDPGLAPRARTLYEIRVGGQSLWVLVNRRQVSFPEAPPGAPAAVLEAPPPVLAEVLTGVTDLDAALAAGRLRLDGSRRAATRFVQAFRVRLTDDLPSAAAPVPDTPSPTG